MGLDFDRSDCIRFLQHADEFLGVVSDLFGDGLLEHVGVDGGIEFNINVASDSELVVGDEFLFIGLIFALFVLEVDFDSAQVDVTSVVED